MEVIMPEQIEHAGKRIVDTLLVLVPNGSVIATIHLMDVRMIGEIILVGLSIAYTIWRWRRDSRKP